MVSLMLVPGVGTTMAVASEPTVICPSVATITPATLDTKEMALPDVAKTDTGQTWDVAAVEYKALDLAKMDPGQKALDLAYIDTGQKMARNEATARLTPPTAASA